MEDRRKEKMREKLGQIVYYSSLACLCLLCLPALFLIASLVRLDDRLEPKRAVRTYED